MNSRDKGARGEREVAAILKGRGYDARRGVQYCGANGDADVVGLPGVHIEVKRVERLNVRKAFKQAQFDAREKEIPLVVHRENGEPYLATLLFDDFLDLYEEASAHWNKE